MVDNMFLFWVFLVGILIASFQDLKRREVDNWLNFLMVSVGIGFVLFEALFVGDFNLLLYGLFVLFLGFVFMLVFYHGHVFGGGDAKLLLALSLLFVGGSFFESGLNFIVFVILVLISGSVYGMIYSFVLYFVNFRSANSKIGGYLMRMRFWWFFGGGFILLLVGCFGDWLISRTIFLFGVLLFVFPLMFAFAKGLEDVCMIRKVKGKDLREGELLAEDVKVGKKTIKACFEGVSVDEIKLLKNRYVLVKGGIPYVPAFLFGFVLYYFFRDYLVGVLSVLF